MQTEKLNLNAILTEAHSAAVAATAATVNANPDQWYPCGFAWVRIRPARGAFVNFLKEVGAGYTSEEGGYVVYNPSNNVTQRMDAKMVGAEAFAKVLRDAGINARAECRMD